MRRSQGLRGGRSRVKQPGFALFLQPKAFAFDVDGGGVIHGLIDVANLNRDRNSPLHRTAIDILIIPSEDMLLMRCRQEAFNELLTGHLNFQINPFQTGGHGISTQGDIDSLAAYAPRHPVTTIVQAKGRPCKG